jgi:hypothetical protein
MEYLLYFFTFVGMLFWFGFWSSQAGRSISSVSPELDDWQDLKSWGSEVPEAIIALTFATIATVGWNALFDLQWYYLIAIFLGSTVISYAGKQSATWAYLNWEGHTKDSNGDGVHNEDDARKSSTWVWNRWLASRLGYEFGSEGFSWVWAFTKGLITTFPVMAFGAIFQPIGREIASHAKGRLPFESNFWMEGVGDAIGYAGAGVTFLALVQIIQPMV